MSKFEKDLTIGSVPKKLIRFALPFMLSNLIQSLYNIADMLIVGRFVGTHGISGVNVGGQVTFIMTNVAISLCLGGTIVIGQYIGAKDRENAKNTIGTLLTFLLAMAIIITVLMLLFSDYVLMLIQTPPESFQYAKDYLNITILGAVFIFGYNALSGIMRGLGDSKTPLYLVATACIINVGLDLLLVGALGMEVRGAAIATIISQAISLFLCVLYLGRQDFMFDFKLASFKIHSQKLRLIVTTGMPILIQNVAMQLSFLTMTGLANSLGVTASAALGVVARYNGFAILPSLAVGSSISAMVAQNMGAGNIDRAKNTLWAGLATAYAVSIPIYILTQFFSGTFVSWFDNDPELIQSGVAYLRFFSLEYLTVPLYCSLLGLITGSGHTGFSSFVAIVSSLLIRLPIAVVMVNYFNWGLEGIGISAPIASITAALVAFVYFKSGRWQVQTIVKTPAQSKA